MILKDFITRFIARNSIIKLWRTCDGNIHEPLTDKIMEWEILREKCDYSKYLFCNIKHVMSILDINNPDTINIVIETNSEL